MADDDDKDYEEISMKPTIIQVDPGVVENSLFRSMGYQADSHDSLELTKELEELKGIPDKVGVLLELLTRNYLRTLLGGQIISPLMGEDIVLDRVVQFTEMLMSVYIKNINKLVKNIEAKKISGEDFEIELVSLIEYMDSFFIVIREVMNRLITVMHINAPQPVRPPLVNVKIGYDKTI